MSNKPPPASKIEIPVHFERIRYYHESFMKEHPDYERNVFLMMRYRETEPFLDIYEAIRNCLSKHGLNCLRADRKEYTEQVWDNICVYMLGCRYGIAVYEDIEEREFSPNISLEVGFMIALGKKILFLKDSRLKALPTDIAGHLYKNFDSYKAGISIGMQISSWLAAMDIKKPFGPEIGFRPSGVSTSLGLAAKPPQVKETIGVMKRLSHLYFQSNPPESEQQIKHGLKVLLSAVGLEFTEEHQEIHYEGRCSRPDLCSETSDICIKVKFCRSINQVKTIVAEIIADILPLMSAFNDIIFLIYDLGFISDIDYLKNNIEGREGVHLAIVTQ